MRTRSSFLKGALHKTADKLSAVVETFFLDFCFELCFVCGIFKVSLSGFLFPGSKFVPVAKPYVVLPSLLVV